MGGAAKHLDPIVGVDMHMVQPPPPAPPVMMPIPFAGYLIDPTDYGSCKVRLNGFPPARAGTPGIACPPHIPPGGMFVKPPTSECEMYQGSSVVVFAGEAAAAQGHPVLTCHDVGMPAPVRSWRKVPTKSLMMAAANVLPIPGATVVMINGAPTLTMSASSTDETREEETVLVTIELEVFDGFELPIANEKFELHLPNGDIEEGTLDDKGYVKVSDVPPGYCLLVLPQIDEPPDDRFLLALEPGTLDDGVALPALPSGTDVQYVVESRQSMRDVCLRHGLVQWRAMFLDASNDALREARGDRAILLPDDEVTVRVPVVPVATYIVQGIALEAGAKHSVHVAHWPERFGHSF